MSDMEFKQANKNKTLNPGIYRYEIPASFHTSCVYLHKYDLPDDQHTSFTIFINQLLWLISNSIKTLDDIKPTIKEYIERHQEFSRFVLKNILSTKSQGFYWLKAMPPMRLTREEFSRVFNLLMELCPATEELISTDLEFEKFICFIDVVEGSINIYSDKICGVLMDLFTTFDVRNPKPNAVEQVVSVSSAENTKNLEYLPDTLQRIKAIFMNKSIKLECQYEFTGYTFLHDIIRVKPDYCGEIIVKLYEICKESNRSFNYCMQDFSGKTPLLLAIQMRNISVAKALLSLQKNYNILVGVNIPDKQGRTPIMYAALLGCYELYNDLLENGANCLMLDNNGNSAVDFLYMPESEIIKSCEEIHLEPQRSKNVPHSWLLSRSRYKLLVNIDQWHQEHRVPMTLESWGLIQPWLNSIIDSNPLLYRHVLQQFECFIKLSDSHITFLQYCLNQRRIGINILKLQTLRQAVGLGDIPMVTKLLSENVDVNAQVSTGKTLLHFAVYRLPLVTDMHKTYFVARTPEQCLVNHPPIFKLLLEKNADLFKENSMGNSVASIICRSLGTNTGSKDLIEIERVGYIEMALIMMELIASKLKLATRKHYNNIENQYHELAKKIAQPIFDLLHQLLGPVSNERYGNIWRLDFKNMDVYIGIIMTMSIPKEGDKAPEDDKYLNYYRNIFEGACVGNIPIRYKFILHPLKPKYALLITNVPELIKEHYVNLLINSVNLSNRPAFN